MLIKERKLGEYWIGTRTYNNDKYRCSYLYIQLKLRRFILRRPIPDNLMRRLGFKLFKYNKLESELSIPHLPHYEYEFFEKHDSYMRSICLGASVAHALRSFLSNDNSKTFKSKF